jgi:hypothetical protein
MCPIRNGMKQRDAIYLLLPNFALERTIMMAKEGLKLNGPHQLLVLF